MSDLVVEYQDLYERYQKLKDSFKLEKKKAKLIDLQGTSVEVNFWNDTKSASSIMQEIGDLESEINDFEQISGNVLALKEFADNNQLGEEFKDDLTSINNKLRELEIASFLSGSHDKNNAIFGIHAGQGGTEAMDWTSMLYRMYTRFFTQRGWKYEVLDITSGEEAGIKGVTMMVKGNFAYGYLKNEAGTHRLVRQSPFNADNLRQTSFALVEVMPELSNSQKDDINIKEDDLDWQFYRSSGSGGQNVNKVSTAVRLTHKPSGITVTSQTQRFQQQNRENALELLRSRLWIKKNEEEQNKAKNIKGEYRPASWGTQIRSYVLHPYKMVKDLRTKVESPNPEAVLDGDLNEFIEAELVL